MQELAKTWQPNSTFSVILLNRFTQSRFPSKGSFGCFAIPIKRKRPTKIKIIEADNATDTIVPAFRTLQGYTLLANGLDGEHSWKMSTWYGLPSPIPKPTLLGTFFPLKHPHGAMHI
jgi:hypothetical protein